jgi:hypothetical protein
MTTVRECNFRVSPGQRVSLQLQLDKVGVVGAIQEAARRRVAWRGEFADNHGNLVAGIAPGTVCTVLQHFVGQGLMWGDAKVEMLEERGDAREETDALDLACFGSIEKGADEQAAGSLSLAVMSDSDRTDFSQVVAVDVEGGATDELARGGFDDGEGADVRADFRVAPGEQGAVVGEGVDELVDGAGVLQ